MRRLLVRLLPRITAHAAECSYQYRCLTAGACKVWQRRRVCCCPAHYGPWQSVGCCGGTCC